MKKQVSEKGFKLWVSANETYDWAQKTGRSGASWPCSELSSKRLFVEFDSRGLVDLAINGRVRDCPNDELTALVTDHIQKHLPADHPCQDFMNSAEEDKVRDLS